MLKLNLGSCDRHLDGFVSVDKEYPLRWPGNVEFIRADLEQSWPWDDSTVDEVMALDFVEHLRDRIFTMNELHRVLRPGGKATIETPNASHGAGYFQDPTHKTPWAMNTFQYFRAGSFAQQRLAKSYGITASFNVLQLGEFQCKDEYEEVWKIRAVLEAVK